MTDLRSEDVKFEGEEAGAGLASPGLDLMAAGFLLALAIVTMAASLTLPVPGNWTTAPGLLPFLAGASLAVMAILLGLSAQNRRRAGVTASPGEARNSAEDRRTALLAGAVAVYIAALQFMAFQIYFTAFGTSFVLSAFEPVTIVALATIIHLFWRGPLWITALVCVGWTLTLSLVFQKLFQIPLPGGF